MGLIEKIWGCLLGLILAVAGLPSSNPAYSPDALGNLAAKSGVAYQYLDPAHAHAVTHLNGVPHYSYDANGNVTSRTEDGTTYTQAYDAENRLYTVTVNSQITIYTYDADGGRVKKLEGGAGRMTIYVGQHFEKRYAPATTTSYYFLGGQRVAMRQAGALYYLLTDHLGSTSVVTNQSGGIVAQQLYKPWGESRWSSGALPTDRKFTGQRSEEASLGSLYDFQARNYSPRLGRFLSPDTIVPSPGTPQDLNRYTYSRNNPLAYTDPSGHFPFWILLLLAAGVGGYEAFAVPDTAYAPSVDTDIAALPPSQVSVDTHVVNIAINTVVAYEGVATIAAGYNWHRWQRTTDSSDSTGTKATSSNGQVDAISQEGIATPNSGIRGAPPGAGDSGGPTAGRAVTRAQRDAALESNRSTNALENYACANCGYENSDPSHFDVDHIIPKSQGGNTDRQNLRVLCVGCNRSAQETWSPKPGSDWATKYPQSDMRWRRYNDE